MNWNEICERARRLSELEIAEQVKSLSDDERFPALIADLIQKREHYVREAISRQSAHIPTQAAHANGSAFAMEVLLDSLRAITEKPHPSAKRRARKVQEIEET